jgi:CRP-like cAMP-binding protein
MAEAADSTEITVENRLLSGLPAAEWERLGRHLRPVQLSLRDTLHTPNDPIDHVYFLNSGWASLVVTLADGLQAEVGLVGREGMTGLSVVHGIRTDITEAVVQAPGEALRMRAAMFRLELPHLPELAIRLLRYSDALLAQTKQIAACNGHHSLEKRLARWLLMVQDRAGGTELSVTQELLAMMLCVHRPSVSVAASRLQRDGLIRQAAGKVTILDRPGLKCVSCDCYSVIENRYWHLNQ